MKNSYSLVIRDTNSNDIKLIKKSTLEEIDKYTISKSKEEIILDLLQDKKIDSINQDIFIVKRKGNNINYLEPIYNNTYYKNSLIKAINKDKTGNINILNDFIKNMKNNVTYYKFVNLNLTDIYKKFYDYFRFREMDLDILIRQKYNDGKWAITSYPLARNIVESFNRYNMLNNGNIIDNAYNYSKNITNERNKCKNAIYIITDKEYIDGQLDFFNIVRYNDSDNNILEIDTLLNNINIDTFKIDNKEIIINSNNEYNYYLDIIIKRIDNELLKLIYIYSKNKDEKTKKEILKRISSNNNEVFLLLKLYNEYINSKGDEYGTSYRKKNN